MSPTIQKRLDTLGLTYLIRGPNSTSAPTSFVFADDFNRVDQNLEVSSNWTRVGGSAGDATIVSNRCAVPTTNSASYFHCPDTNSTNHYVEADWMTVVHGTGPFLACRLAGINNNNFVGARWDNTGGRIQLFKRVSSTFTNIANFTTSLVAGDRIRLECSGDNARVLLNGVEVIAPTSLAGSLPNNTLCGLVPRLIIVNPWIDNFEAGAL